MKILQNVANVITLFSQLKDLIRVKSLIICSKKKFIAYTTRLYFITQKWISCVKRFAKGKSREINRSYRYEPHRGWK